MSVFQILIGFLLLLSWAIRPILYRPIARTFAPQMSSAFTSTWLLVALLLTFPLLGSLLTDRFSEVFSSVYVLVTLYKGATLFYLIKLQQTVNKKSTSSSVFLSFIALAFGALANNLFFHEGLGLIKVICILGFGVLGVMFLIKGDAKRLSAEEKNAFFLVTLIMASYTVADHLAIPHIGWYPHVLISSAMMFVVSFWHGISKQDFKNMFQNKQIIGAGLFYAFSEFFVIYVSFNILPVSIVAVFLRLSVPVVMVFSAVKYKEQSLKNQLIFGVVAILLALPIILIKN